MGSIKIGILGFGAMGKVHAYAISNLKYFFSPLGFEPVLSAICTTSYEKSQKIAKDYGFELAAKEANEIIENDNIDVIDICTPNNLHFDSLKKAILKGKAIYCEKPLCFNYAEAKEIAALSEKHGTLCNIVFNNRHLAPVMRAKEIIDSGKLGRILSFSCEYLHNSALDPDKVPGWKQIHDVCGGGVLVDLGAHCIDLIYFLCGKFDSVSGHSQIAFPTRTTASGDTWQTDADEAFYMFAKLKSGACGTITMSKIASGSNDDLNFTIRGEKGALSFSLMQPNFLRYYDGAVSTPTLGGYCGFTDIECVGRYPAPAGLFPSPKSSSSWLRGHVQSMYDFLSSIDQKKPSKPNFRDGAYVQAVIEAGYISDAEGRTVNLSEIDREL